MCLATWEGNPMLWASPGLSSKADHCGKMGAISWVEMVTRASAFSHLTKTCMQSGVMRKSINQPVCSLYGYSFGPGMQQGSGWRMVARV